MSYRPGGRRLRPTAARRAGDLLDAARRVDGLAPVRRDPRAARARLLGQLDPARLRRRPGAAAVRGPRVEQVRSRPTGGCARSSPSCASDGPTESEVERARAYAAGARAIAFENTGAVARHAAQQTIVYREDVDPDSAIELLDAVTSKDVTEVAAQNRRRAVGRGRRAAHGGGVGGGIRRRTVVGGVMRRGGDRVVRLRRRRLARAAEQRGSRRPARRSSTATTTPTHRHRPAAAPEVAAASRGAWLGALRRAGPAHRRCRLRPHSRARALFAVRDDVTRPPASVEKLYTTIAVLAKLGPTRFRLTTTVLGTGHLGRRRGLARQPLPARRRRSDVRRRHVQPHLGARLRPDGLADSCAS